MAALSESSFDDMSLICDEDFDELLEAIGDYEDEDNGIEVICDTCAYPSCKNHGFPEVWNLEDGKISTSKATIHFPDVQCIYCYRLGFPCDRYILLPYEDEYGVMDYEVCCRYCFIIEHVLPLFTDIHPILYAQYINIIESYGLSDYRECIGMRC